MKYLLLQRLKCIGIQLLEQASSQLKLYRHRLKSRKALLRLDEDRLKDIGITREQAQKEGKRFFLKGNNFESTQ